MTHATGAGSQLVFDNEATWGTSPGTPHGLVIPFVSCSLAGSKNLIESQTIRSGRNPQKPVIGNQVADGDLVVELNPLVHGFLLRQAMGDYGVVDQTGTYLHTMKIGTLPAGFLLDLGFTDLTTPKYHIFNGCRISRMAMELTPEGYLKTTFGIMAKKETVGSAAYDATPDNDYSNDPWVMSQITLTEGGSAIASVTALSLEIVNNLDGNLFAIGGGGQRNSIPSGIAKVSGKVTCLFDDAHGVGLYTKANAGTESSISATGTRGAGDGTLAAEVMNIYLDELLFKPNGVPVNGPQGIMLDLDFEAYYDNDSDANAMRITLDNTVPDYSDTTAY
jgi:hypothetical protein